MESVLDLPASVSSTQNSVSCVRTLEWCIVDGSTASVLKLLDQTKLPDEVAYVIAQTAEDVICAIRTMIVRGAPAIGIAGAYAVVLAAQDWLRHPDHAEDSFCGHLEQEASKIKLARPTAVNLSWAVEQMLDTLHAMNPLEDTAERIFNCLLEKAHALFHADIAINKAIGDCGAGLVPKGARILTHCNAGALATCGYGTALGVIRSAFASDTTIRVYADETRPRLQGARLTAWELQEDGIPVTLITDNMSGSLMRQGQVDLVIVGADRIAANGDTANKIGTYNLAVLAHAHHIPFYVAAPLSTIDLTLAIGDEIPIEERSAEEIYRINDTVICPLNIDFYNPAFDVTPARLIHGIITEKGIAKPPYATSLVSLFSS